MRPPADARLERPFLGTQRVKARSVIDVERFTRENETLTKQQYEQTVTWPNRLLVHV
jgi:hypothetical protein